MTLSRELRTLLAPRIKALRTIWLAFTVAPVLYVVMAYFITMNVTPERLQESAAALPMSSTMMLTLGLGLAAVLAVVSILVRQRLLTDETLLAAAHNPPSGGELTSVPDSARPVMSAFYRIQTSFIIVAAIQEAIVLIGLVLVFLSRVFVNIVPFAIASVVLLMTSRPSEDTIERRLASVARRFE